MQQETPPRAESGQGSPLTLSVGEERALAAELQRHLQLAGSEAPAATDAAGAFKALSHALRERLAQGVARTRKQLRASGARQVHYLSMEFLMGRLLANAIGNLGLDADAAAALRGVGVELEDLHSEEPEAGLGNGGLGRLAACFLDSCASLALPVTGYGIRYRYGMFRQALDDGHQVELPDPWLQKGYPWEIRREEHARRVPFFGHTVHGRDADGRIRVHLENTEDVVAVPFDVPVPGFRNGHVNVLRLWSAKAAGGFDLGAFNAGHHLGSVARKNQAEEISMVLYPADDTEAGRLLRLRQQYFLCSATLQDALAAWLAQGVRELADFAAGNCFQLNDTHPVCAIPELMRLLLDVHGLEWDVAWKITQGCMAYTNHTLLPEALEQWPIAMFDYLLPRIAEIIREIDRRFRADCDAHWPGDVARAERMAVISRGDNPQVRMANLGVIGAFSVNGVAELHSALLQRELFPDFHALWPQRFNNKTNGVTHRRWLLHCNPALSGLLCEAIGKEWIHTPERLQALTPFAADAAFRTRWHAVRLHNKRLLGEVLQRSCGFTPDPTWLFDVQVKRIHEYKRQLLNLLHVLWLLDAIRHGETAGMVPRCVLIGGKAAPGYRMAKLIIKLACDIAVLVDAEPLAKPWLRLAYVPDYSVSLMERICPATDLSQQISTAGKEASGTGNMKFMMNGALTIGTMDGANIEMHDALGGQDFFRFGLDAPGVAATRGRYDPQALADADPALARVLAMLVSGEVAGGDAARFRPVLEALLSPTDPWMCVADFASYRASQCAVAEAFADREAWIAASVRNTAASGIFSSDRTIREYATGIWGVGY